MKKTNRVRRARLPMLAALAVSLLGPSFSGAVSDGAWKVVNRSLTAFEDGGRKAVRLDERPGQGIAWLDGTLFAEGTIEFEVRGRDVEQRSFVGVAFHAADDQSFEAVYFRPFNFRSADPEKAGRAVQYVSHPEFTWQKLRAEKPGRYEKAVRPVPDPNGWFRVRVVCARAKVGVYVDGSPEPCLEVEELGDRKQGMVGLFVGNGSGGDFARLVITPSKQRSEGSREDELFGAIRAGDLARVRAMVETDPATIETRLWGGMTILFPAVELGKTDIARYLISKGADVNAVSKYRGMPLDLALDGGDAGIIELLRSRGARSTPLEFETHRLSENVHRVAFPWGMRNNVVVFSGPDGILLVDSGFSKHAVETLRRTIGSLTRGEITYVINTHPHGDHVGGNGLVPSGGSAIGLGDLDGPGLEGVISRSGPPSRGRSGKELQAPYVMRYNGEDIRIIPNPGLHSQSDILIHFPKANVLCMGDLLLSQSCPAVQNVSGYMEFLDKVLDIFPPETIFVSGHGKDLTADGLRKYRADLGGMIAVVKERFAAGQSAEEMVREDALKAYKAEYSFLDWLGPDSWLVSVFRGLAAGVRVP